MQVKSLLVPDQTTTCWPNYTADRIEKEGSAILNRWRNSDTGDNIVLTGVHGSGAYGESFDPDTPGIRRRCMVLYILGGRQSIVSWLRLQGQAPKVIHNMGDMSLYGRVMRKSRRFGKDLTMVAIYPYEDLPFRDDGWDTIATVDLRKSPEAPVSLYTKKSMGEFEPRQLASIFERLFAGLPW